LTLARFLVGRGHAVDVLAVRAEEQLDRATPARDRPATRFARLALKAVLGDDTELAVSVEPVTEAGNRVAEVFGSLPGSLNVLVSLALVRPHERARTVLEDGVTWEELVAPGQSLEPAMLIVPPGASSGGPITRPGDNFVLMLSGELCFDLLDDAIVMQLHPGDALMLVAGSTWSWENRGSTEATAVWVEHLLPGAWQGS